nr:hypothetical protein [Paenibacillus sp. Leaf72]
MKELMTELGNIVREGMGRQEFRSDLDVEAACSVVIGLIEGGVMMSKLFDDAKYIRHCAEQAKAYIKERIVA